jgi:hypothetical protein
MGGGRCRLHCMRLSANLKGSGRAFRSRLNSDNYQSTSNYLTPGRSSVLPAIYPYSWHASRVNVCSNYMLVQRRSAFDFCCYRLSMTSIWPFYVVNLHPAVATYIIAFWQAHGRITSYLHYEIDTLFVWFILRYCL